MVSFKEFTLLENKVSLLEEGGVAGHMSHIYDNWDLSFSQIKDILTKASQGQLQGTEKTDGQNLYISYSVKESRAKAARNKGDIKNGGMTVPELRQKFAGRGAIEDTFGDALRIFEKAVRALSPQQQTKIFGPDTDIWYNAEVMDPRSSNVINYDKKTLAIHQVGHAMYDKQTGEPTDVNVSKNVAVLDNALNDMQEAIQDENYHIIKNAVRNLEALSNDSALRVAIQNLDTLLSREGLDESTTIKDYIKKKIWDYLSKKLPKEVLQLVGNDLVQRMMGEGGSISSIAKVLPPEYKQQVKDIVKDDKKVIKNAVYPIEDIIHDFAVEILKSVQSAYIINNQKEVKRLKNEVARAIKLIQSSNNEIAHEVLKQQLKKLKSVDKINSAIEGFVFDYDGHSYKMTGNFAPVNQILGLFRYGRAGVKPEEFK